MILLWRYHDPADFAFIQSNRWLALQIRLQEDRLFLCSLFKEMGYPVPAAYERKLWFLNMCTYELYGQWSYDSDAKAIRSVLLMQE